MIFFRNINRYRAFLRDITYSSLAHAFPTSALYFIILPIIARLISSEDNGVFLTQMSLVRFCCNILISSLANLRLLEKPNINADKEMEKKFNFLFLIASLIGIITTIIVISFYMPGFGFIDLLLTLLFLILLFFHDYYSIKFRVDINFQKVTIDNIFIVVGLFIGLIFFYFTLKWQYVFIGGYLVGCIYVFIHSKEMLRSSIGNPNYPTVNKRYFELGASYGLNKASVYCDKLLIYPVLGGTSVSIYNAASVFSKIITLISVPIRSVLLSYLVDKNTIKISKKNLYNGIYLTPVILIFVVLSFSALGYVFCKFLYPMFVADAAKFIIFIVSAIVIESIGGIFNLLVIKFRNMRLQIIFSSIKLISYLCLVVILTIIMGFGLWGFCIATLLSSFLYMIVVLYFAIKCVNIEIN